MPLTLSDPWYFRQPTIRGGGGLKAPLGSHKLMYQSYQVQIIMVDYTDHDGNSTIIVKIERKKSPFFTNNFSVK